MVVKENTAQGLKQYWQAQGFLSDRSILIFGHSYFRQNKD